MPASCSAFGCTNRFKRGGSKQFLGFPLKNEELLKLWMALVKRKNFTPTSASKLCSDHFIDSDYLVRPGTYVRHLKPDAVPSVFSCYQEKEKKVRLSSEQSSNYLQEEKGTVQSTNKKESALPTTVQRLKQQVSGLNKSTNMRRNKTKGQRCCVMGCQKDTAIDRGVSFHVFPKDEKLRKVWISRVNMQSNRGKYSLWTPTKYHRICGIHFNENGKKTYNDKYPRFFPNKTYPPESMSAPVGQSEVNFGHENVDPLSIKSEPLEDEDNTSNMYNSGDEAMIFPESLKNEELIIKFEPMEDEDGSDTYISVEHNYSLEMMSLEECALLIKKLKNEVYEIREQYEYEAMKENDCRS